MKWGWALSALLLGACQSWQDPLNSREKLDNARASLPRINYADCQKPDWKALSFEQSVTTGLCKHPDSRAAFAEMESRTAAWGGAQSAYLPTLSASYRREHSRNTASYGHDNRQNPGRLLAEMQWVLFDFGERAANRTQYAHLLRLAAASHDRQLQTRWATIARSYVRTDIAGRKLAIAADSVAVAAQLLETVKTLHDAGTTIGADVDEAQIEHQRAKLQLLQSGQEQNVAQAALAESMGYGVETAMQLQGIDEKHFDRQDMDDIKTLLEDMLSIHPQVIEAQAKADATAASLAAIRHAGAPQIFLYGTSTLNHHLHNRGLRYRENDHVIGVGIRWPLFEGYRRHYQIMELTARHEKELAELEALQSRLSLDIWQAHQQWQTARAQHEVARQGAETAEKNMQTHLGRYRAGVGALRDVLQARRSLYELRMAQTDALQARHEAALQLIFSAGQALSSDSGNFHTKTSIIIEK